MPSRAAVVMEMRAVKGRGQPPCTAVEDTHGFSIRSTAVLLNAVAACRTRSPQAFVGIYASQEWLLPHA